MGSNKPKEISSKSNIIKDNCKNKGRDPRFGELCGKFNYSKFKKMYNFVEEDKKLRIEALKEAIREEKEIEIKKELERLLDRLRAWDERMKRGELTEKIKNIHKRNEYEKILKGKKPYYLKRRDLKLKLNEEIIKDNPKGLRKKIKKLRKKFKSKKKKKFPDRK